MGGDHKCPVCQATFTRPQHVARHMRSHTGDRPYKCQHCGDQFARSDLLARHINKCHANEKPLPNVISGGRRKGSAAASRAITSKQACDQCVQSSLPCDGSNPCSKCVSRKCRCTYVKFHRQTAPSGPGHLPPRSPSSSSSSLNGSVGPSLIPSGLTDAFALAQQPSVPPVTTTSFPGADQIFNTPFTFNPAAPSYPPNWTSADVFQLPFTVASEPDLSARYRAQPEFLRRAGPSIITDSPVPVLPNMYANQPNQPPSSNWYPTWGEPGTYPPLDDTKPFDGMSRPHSLTSSEPSSFAPEFYGAGLVGSAYRPRKVSLDFSDSSSATSQSVPSSATSSNVHLPLPGNEMYSGSDEMQRQTHEHALQHQRRSSMPTTQPAPFHVPSDPPQLTSTQQPHREGSFSSAFGLMSIDDPNVLAGLSTSDGVPFFSNLGMGLLPHSPNATPMPSRVQHAHLHQGRERGMSLGALPTPGLTKDAADTRELKEMWKTYLRSPLSGSGTGTLDLPSLGQMPQSPSSQRRRVRVSSLPSVTPTVEKGHPLVGHERHANGEVGASGAPGAGVVGPGSGDDLRSYEAAVNARSASLKLNLVPKRRGARPSLRASSAEEEMGMGHHHHHHHHHHGGSSSAVMGGHGEQQGISRPSSSSSTSSLAQAFTVLSPPYHPNLPNHNHNNHTMHAHAHGPGTGVVKPPPMQGASISLPVPPTMSMSAIHSNSHTNSHSHSHPHHAVAFGSSVSLTFEPGSRASSVTSDGTGTGGSGSDGEVFRPSFKRNASQTLGPPSSKRALVERPGAGSGRGGSSKTRRSVTAVKVDSLSVNGGVRVKGEVRDSGGGMREELEDGNGNEMEGFERVVGTGSPGSRPIAALPERAKRA